MTNAVLVRDEVGIPPLAIDSGEVANEVSRPASDVSFVEGDAYNYTIDYVNGVTEIGGIKSVTANVVTNGIVEGVVTIPTQFRKVLNVQATALNVVAEANTLNSEKAHVAVDGTTVKLYVSANSNSSTTIPVSWTVKGIK